MIRQFVSSDFCLACKGCCRFTEAGSCWSPNLTDVDIAQLMQYGVPPSTITAEKRLRLIPDAASEAFLCPCLDKQSARCKAYASRPLECQLYPFLINRQGKEVFLAVDVHCPYIEKHGLGKEFESYVAYLCAGQGGPGLSSLIRQYPQLIQEYEGAANLTKIL